MKYNPFGYRFFSGESNQDGDVFLYSSQGQLVAKYSISGNTLKLNYLPIYEGSRRIGIVEPSGVSWLDCPELMLCGLVAIDPCMLMVEGQPKPPCRKDSSFKADRKYEIVDHLGNVRVVIANQRLPVDTNGDSLVDYYKPLVKNVHDYYPFGWEKQLTTVDPYPFTYQGQLFDKELGWQYYRYRNYDPKVGRFWQVEPLIDKYPWLGYVFSENNVISFIELEGLEKARPTGEYISDEEGMHEVYELTEVTVVHERRTLWDDIKELLSEALEAIGDFLRELDRAMQGDSEETVEGGIMFTSKSGQNMNSVRARNPDRELVNIDTFLIFARWPVRLPPNDKVMTMLQGTKHVAKDMADMGVSVKKKEKKKVVKKPKEYATIVDPKPYKPPRDFTGDPVVVETTHGGMYRIKAPFAIYCKGSGCPSGVIFYGAWGEQKLYVTDPSKVIMKVNDSYSINPEVFKEFISDSEILE